MSGIPKLSRTQALREEYFQMLHLKENYSDTPLSKVLCRVSSHPFPSFNPIWAGREGMWAKGQWTSKQRRSWKNSGRRTPTAHTHIHT